MPSQALTLILNSNNSKRSTVLLPFDPLPDPLTWILTEARNKFHIKTLSRVFLRGGYELSEASDTKDLDMAWGTSGLNREVWVSKGEDYEGPNEVVKGNRRSDASKAEVRVIALESFIDKKAIKQLNNIAEMEGVCLVVGLPDLHPGIKWPIGCSVLAEGIYPELIGTDIGCGIALYSLSPLPSHPNPTKISSLLRDLDSPYPSASEFLAGAPYNITTETPFDKTSLGTVGGGNHFAEICMIEEIFDEGIARDAGVNEGMLYLLVHTGSRGLGAQILQSFTTSSTPGTPYLYPETPEFTSYLSQHDHALKWATANRDLLAQRIYDCLFPPSDLDLENTGSARTLRKIVDIYHNAVIPTTIYIPSTSNPGEVEEKEVWTHRKGAAPADKGLIPCPGSRGALSYLILPTPPATPLLSGISLPHGAGRLLARSSSSNSLSPSQSAHLTTTALGSEVICTAKNLLIEERPECYKDIECVVSDVEARGVGRRVASLRPIVTYKIREAGERK